MDCFASLAMTEKMHWFCVIFGLFVALAAAAKNTHLLPTCHFPEIKK
jgi:hypothetical protein